MREPLKQVQDTTGKTRSIHRRTVLPLPADAVDAAFADGVELQLPAEDNSADSLSYAEVVSRVNYQLNQLEEQRKQLRMLLEQAEKSVR